MKKVLAVILALATPCAAVAQTTHQTLDKIRESKTITIGYNETTAPFSFTGSDGQPQGYSVELCKRVANEVKAELKLSDLKVNYVPVTSQTRIPLLVNGTIDLECASTTETLTRSKQVDFSINHFVTGTRCMVWKNSDMPNFNKFDGKIVALVQGSTTERHIDRLAAERKINVRKLSITTFSEGLIALESNRVDAFCSDDSILRGLISKSQNKDDLVINDEMLSFEPLALMVRRDDSDFRLLVNTVLSDTFQAQDFKDFYNKWFAPIGLEYNDRTQLFYQLIGIPH